MRLLSDRDGIAPDVRWLTRSALLSWMSHATFLTAWDGKMRAAGIALAAAPSGWCGYDSAATAGELAFVPPELTGNSDARRRSRGVWLQQSASRHPACDGLSDSKS
jgi:hypothetical protein